MTRSMLPMHSFREQLVLIALPSILLGSTLRILLAILLLADRLHAIRHSRPTLLLRVIHLRPTRQLTRMPQ